MLFSKSEGLVFNNKNGKEGRNIFCFFWISFHQKINQILFFSTKKTDCNKFEKYEGKRLNSPNDLVFDKSGSIYFTDPPYGLKMKDDDTLKELNFNGIYKWSESKGIELLSISMKRPNGIILSKDEKTVYVGNSDKDNNVIIAFDNDNGLKNERIFFDGNKLSKSRIGLFDGLKLHSSGIIFTTGPGGVLLLDPKGKHLGTIMPGKATANCAFDSDESYLYLTSDNVLARIKLKS